MNLKEGIASRKKENEKKKPLRWADPDSSSLCPGEDWCVTDFWPSELNSEELLCRKQNMLVHFSNASLMTAKWFVGGYEKCPSPLALPSATWHSVCSPWLLAARWWYLWFCKEWICQEMSHSTTLPDPLQPGGIWKLPTELTKQVIYGAVGQNHVLFIPPGCARCVNKMSQPLGFLHLWIWH